MNGKIRWFNCKNGYGFIIPDDGGKDVMLHMTVCVSARYLPYREDVVSYTVRSDNNLAAETVNLIESSPYGKGVI